MCARSVGSTAVLCHHTKQVRVTTCLSTRALRAREIRLQASLLPPIPSSSAPHAGGAGWGRGQPPRIGPKPRAGLALPLQAPAEAGAPPCPRRTRHAWHACRCRASAWRAAPQMASVAPRSVTGPRQRPAANGIPAAWPPASLGVRTCPPAEQSPSPPTRSCSPDAPCKSWNICTRDAGGSVSDVMCACGPARIGGAGREHARTRRRPTLLTAS